MFVSMGDRDNELGCLPGGYAIATGQPAMQACKFWVSECFEAFVMFFDDMMHVHM
jgi:hypothetical protein